ncbi:MAG: hypothetical protein JWP86_3187 [Phenylobacterium sp.]|nr:hypothetical protein [Phenylobacterium sp.]
MATQIYTDGAASYDARTTDGEAARDSYRSAGEQIFLWVAWTLAFAFWAFSMSTAVGILDAIAARPPGGLEGGVDPGGGGVFLMSVVAVVLLGIAIAYGAARWATRDKRLDPVTEASTAALYDAVDRSGGDDMISRSPEARRPDERDSYRPA